MVGCPIKVLRAIGRSRKLQLTRGTRGVHTGDQGAAISGGNTIWFAGKVAVGLGFGVVLAGNWLEGNLGKKNIFHGEKKHEDRQTIPDVSPKYKESSQGEAKENCIEGNPRESQESRNDMEALTNDSDCNSFLSLETHSQSPGLPPEDQSSTEHIKNTEYNHRCLQIDNLDNQHYSPDHSCDNR